jgi:hypothetical protein
MAASLLSQLCWAGFLGVLTGQEMPTKRLDLVGGFVGESALDLNRLTDVGKSGAIWFYRGTTDLANLVAAVITFGLDKRGEAWASLVWAWVWTVGWLSRT